MRDYYTGGFTLVRKRMHSEIKTIEILLLIRIWNVFLFKTGATSNFKIIYLLFK